ncbi:MAG: CoA synthetase [Rhodospirillaceae bacterium]|nr:CoA synthetase [Rhodospirillaceae bacterium]
MSDVLLADVDALAARVPDGAKLAVFKAEGGCAAMAATFALIRRGAGDLHLVTVPTSGLQADMLIGAGCVATVETSGVTLGEYGQAPCFGRAVRSGAVRVIDSTCPAVYAGLQAGEKGIPFMPLRGLIGSDIVRHRDDYRIVDNPFAEDDPIVALPAIVPDIALFHAPLADRSGNVWIGRHAELKIMAHAARTTLVTYERLYDGNLLQDEALAPATIPEMYIGGVAVAERGAWPYGVTGLYEDDAGRFTAYAGMAKTGEGFDAWLEETVYGNAPAVAAE